LEGEKRAEGDGEDGEGGMALNARQEQGPGLVEQYAVAVNTADLDGRALEVLSVMGAARRTMAEDARTEAAAIRRELAVDLWRVRDGKDEAAYARCGALFAAWLRLEWPWIAEIEAVDPGIADRFACHAMHERFRMQCRVCRGGRRMQVLPGGRQVRPFGVGRSYARIIDCQACRGTGRVITGPVDRIKALRGARPIARPEYAELWHRAFFRAQLKLSECANDPHEHLHSAAKGTRVLR
jgi:hypothetical protein